MSSQKKKSVSLPNIDEIRKLSNDSKTDFDEKLKIASKQAFDHIIKGSEKKIKEAAQLGRKSARLYEWVYTENPNDSTYKFNGIKIFDLLKKRENSTTDLLKDLRDYFNPEDKSNGYHVGWSKDKNDTKKSSFYIYVTWNPPKDKE